MAAAFVDRGQGGTISSSESQVGAKARWASRETPPNLAMNRGALVQVDRGLQAVVADLMHRVNPAAAEAFNRHLGPVAGAAFQRWPVDTGLSKSLLTLEYGLSADGATLTGSLVNRAPYALFIRRGYTVRNFIWDPGARAANEMERDIGDELVRR